MGRKSQQNRRNREESGTNRIVLTVVAAIVVIFILVNAFSIPTPAANNPDANATPKPTDSPMPAIDKPVSCITSTEVRTVRGNSMTGLLSDGDNVIVQFGYYGCNEPHRGDVALVHFAGDANPLVKTIKATPGDSFSLSNASCGWDIMVNGRVLQNAQGIDYCIGYSGYRMLSLYVQSYNGVIPQDAYLVLGNVVTGSTDSTRFGLVSRDGLLGKVEIPAKSD